jgi:L-alanine-DL-glutamate epimerase-like enolase superfamily enzyme
MISVVIGFRDWMLDRLTLAVSSHLQCSVADRLEVVVVDYGSKNPHEVRAAVESVGGRVVRTEANGKWNRAAALNFGGSR